MLEAFKNLFRGKNVPDQAVEKYAIEFSKIAIGYIYFDLAPRLSQEEDKHFADLIKNENGAEITEFIKSKYSDEEFAKVLETKISPLVDEYVEMIGSAA